MIFLFCANSYFSIIITYILRTHQSSFIVVVDKLIHTKVEALKPRTTNRPSKSEFFCTDWIFKIKNCAETCTKNAIKHVRLKKRLVRLFQKQTKNWAIFTTFMFKVKIIAHILDTFAQMCVCMSAIFRSSDNKDMLG